MIIINTVMKTNQSLHPKFQKGMEENQALISLAVSSHQDYSMYLLSTWDTHFQNPGSGFYSLGRAENVFIGIQNNLVLPVGSIEKFIRAFDTTWKTFDILFYSDLDGKFNLDTCINDAFFIMRYELTNRYRLEYKDKECPLCMWFNKFIKAGYKIAYYGHEQLEVAEPTILVS